MKTYKDYIITEGINLKGFGLGPMFGMYGSHISPCFFAENKERRYWVGYSVHSPKLQGISVRTYGDVPYDGDLAILCESNTSIISPLYKGDEPYVFLDAGGRRVEKIIPHWESVGLGVGLIPMPSRGGSLVISSFSDIKPVPGWNFSKDYIRYANLNTLMYYMKLDGVSVGNINAMIDKVHERYKAEYEKLLQYKRKRAESDKVVNAWLKYIEKDYNLR